MDIQITSDNARATLALKGKLTVRSSPELDDAIVSLDGSIADIDIDLSEVEYVSSAGLRVFVSSSKLAERRGGTLRLLRPRDEVYEVFQMTGLEEVLVVVR